MAEEKASKAQRALDDSKPAAAEAHKANKPEPQRKPAAAAAASAAAAAAPATKPAAAAAAAASTSTPAVASTAAPAPAAAPKPKQKAAAAPLPEGWKEYVDKATGKSYYYNASSATTTWERPKAASGRASSSAEIQIPTHKSSHSSVDDDESEDESGDEGGAGGKRKLPSWANPKELMSQLQRQHNPTRGDDVFGQQIHLMEEACALKEIFGSEVTNKRHHRRGSSGCWDLDRLTEQEEQAYQKSHNP